MHVDAVSAADDVVGAPEPVPSDLVQAHELDHACRRVAEQRQPGRLTQGIAVARAHQIAASDEQTQNQLERLRVERERAGKLIAALASLAQGLEYPEVHPGHDRARLHQRQEGVKQRTWRHRCGKKLFLDRALRDRSVPHRRDPSSLDWSPCFDRASRSPPSHFPELGTPGPVTSVDAALYCGNETKPALMTKTFPLSGEGNALILERVKLPSNCLAPAVLINPLGIGSIYIATSGFSN